MSVSDIATWIGIAASSALVISVCLLAYNLRESRRDARRNLAFSLMETLTSADFAERRWKMRQVVQGAVAKNWAGFDDSHEDFETRAFAYQYELIGQMVYARTLEYAQLRDFLKYSVVADWNEFSPLEAHLVQRYRPYSVNQSPWSNFRKLADRITRDLRGPPLADSGPLTQPPIDMVPAASPVPGSVERRS